MGQKNVKLRREQFRSADDPPRCLAFARRFVAGKIGNARTLLLRNHPEPPAKLVTALKRHGELAGRAESIDTLLGIEGNAARLYFSEFASLMKPRKGETVRTFDFDGRNRRPPRDPVNAMLSFGYSILARDVTIALHAVGLDPFVGFFHQIRPGRPALALDLMEEFRPIVVDSVVLTVVNNGAAGPNDFIVTKGGCAMKPELRKRYLGAYERRMDTLITHPVFNYRISYRRVLELQARLLGSCLRGEFEEYVPFTTR